MDSRNAVADVSGSSPFSPPRSLAGPSRTRSLKDSNRKPYARPPRSNNGVTTPLTQSPLATRGRSHRHDEDHTSPSSTLSTPPSITQPRAGLFSTLSRAISKPLSWLSTSSHLYSQADQKSILPSSASTGSLLGRDQQRMSTRSALAQDSSGGSMTDKLAKFRGNQTSTDIESRVSTSNSDGAPLKNSSALGFGVGITSSASMSALAPRSNSRRFESTSVMLPPLATSSHITRRTLNISHGDSEGVHDQPSSPVPSSASAAIRSHGRHRSLHHALTLTPGGRRTPSIAPSESSSTRGSIAVNGPAYAYGFGSERRLGGLTKESLTGTAKYGSSTAITPSSSLSYLSSRSPFVTSDAHETAIRRSGNLAGRSSSAILAQSAAGASVSVVSPSRLLGPATPSRAAGSILGSGSRPTMSPAMSRSGSTLGISSRTSRPWSSFDIAPPRARPSDGEEMMKDLASARRYGTPSGSAVPSVISGRDSRANTPLSVKLGKRDASDALDLGGGFGALNLQDRGSVSGSLSGSARKKQMVWDPELGFISMDDLRARQPPAVVPRNEAERILGVLEGMRTSLGDARKEGYIDARARSATSTPSRLTQTISVPLPSPSAARAAQSTPDTRKATRTSSRLNQSTPAPDEDGMRAKLKRSIAAVPSTARTLRRRGRGNEASDEEDEFNQGSAHEAEVEEENEHEEEEVEREPSPPRRVTRNMARAKTREEVLSPPPPSQSTKAATKKAPTKVAPAPKSPARRTGRKKAASPSPHPHSHSQAVGDVEGEEGEEKVGQEGELKEAATETVTILPVQGPSRRKDQFQVLDPALSSAPTSRARSSLRQGIVKASRTHGKSGKISAWDSDDDEDGADAALDGGMGDVNVEELKKIQLPKNLFPQGFKFGSSTGSADLANTTPTFPEPQPTHQQDQGSVGTETSGGSLLGRLGGFAPPASPSVPAKPSPRKTTSGIGFQPPPTESDSTSSVSNFKSAPSILSSSRISKQASAPSNFFATPPTPQARAMDLNKAEDGPKKVPNFFGSSNQPAETGSLAPLPPAAAAAIAISNSSSPAPFSFDGLAPSKTGDEKGSVSAPAPFSFSKADEQPIQTGSTTLPSGFSFGAAAGANGSSPPPSGVLPKKSIPNFFETASSAKKAESNAEGKGNINTSSGLNLAAPSGINQDAVSGSNASVSPFGVFKEFGSAPSAFTSTATPGGSANVKQKRGADDDDQTSNTNSEPESNKRVEFSFGSGTGPTSGSSSSPSLAANRGATGGSGFSFGLPVSPSATATSESAKSIPPAPFSFGKSGDNASGSDKSAQPASSSSGAFSFHSPADPTNGKGVGFSFGKLSESSTGTGGSSVSAAPLTGGFSFDKISAAPSASSSAAHGGEASKASFAFGAPSTPAQPAAIHGSVPSGGNDMMDDTSPSQVRSSGINNGGQQQPSTNAFGNSFGSSKPSGTVGTTGSGGFSFASPVPVSAQGTTGGGFNFGPLANKQQPVVGSSSFSFGSLPAPATGNNLAPSSPFGAVSGPSTPAATPGGFNFGTPSRTAPASPAPTHAALPSGGGAGAGGTGGFNFNFATSGPPNAGLGGTVTPTGHNNAPFSFSTPPAGSTTAQQSNGSAGGAAPFQFGSMAPSGGGGVGVGATTSGVGATPFQFGIGAGGGSTSGAPLAQQQQQQQHQQVVGGGGGSATPNQGQAPPVLFNIGAGASSPAPGPGGRQLKALPRSRRR